MLLPHSELHEPKMPLANIAMPICCERLDSELRVYISIFTPAEPVSFAHEMPCRRREFLDAFIISRFRRSRLFHFGTFIQIRDCAQAFNMIRLADIAGGTRRYAVYYRRADYPRRGLFHC